jgi:hypothetical protein
VKESVAKRPAPWERHVYNFTPQPSHSRDPIALSVISSMNDKRASKPSPSHRSSCAANQACNPPNRGAESRAIVRNNQKLTMNHLSSALSCGRSRPTKSIISLRLFTNAWWCAMAVLAFLPVAFRAWSGECAPTSVGLVSWWPGAGNANDIVGTNNGTLSGGVTFTDGVVGQAFNFNPASGGTVVVPDSPNLRLTGHLTIEAWIFARSLNTTPGFCIVSKLGSATGYNGYQLVLSGNQIFGLFNSPGQGWPSQQVMSGPIITPGTWYHVAFTYDQSAMRLYCNGQPVATNVIGRTPIATSTSDLRISGADNQAYFDGMIDEPSIYNRALSAGQIEAIYNAGSAGKCRSSYAATAMATVVNGFVVGATVTDNGWGYTNTPSVRIFDGSGNGAQAIAVVSNGVVIAVKVVATGSNYTGTPVIVIAPPFIPQPKISITPLFLGPLVAPPVVELDLTDLSPYDKYQLEFTSVLGGAWTSLGTTFTSTSSTNAQYVSASASAGFFRVRYVK